MLLIVILFLVTSFSNEVLRVDYVKGQEKDTESKTVSIDNDKWSVVPKIKEELSIDGKLNEKAWEEAAILSGFETPYYNERVDDTEAKIMYNENTFYIGLKHDDESDTLANFEVILSPNSNGDEFYRIPININNFETSYSNDWGPVISTIEGVQKSTTDNQGLVTAEVAVNLDLLNVNKIEPGDEWRINIVAQHDLNTKPMSSWIPIRTSSIHYTGNVANAYANITDEGRVGSIFMGTIPDDESSSRSIQPWEPEKFSLQYKNFNEKEITFKRKDMNPKKIDVNLKWKSPLGPWESIDASEIKESKEMLTMSFDHPAPLQNGLYQIKLQIVRDGKEVRHSIITFDRNGLIEAGDNTYASSSAQNNKKSIPYEKPSEEVNKLLELIPENTGFIFNGLPDQPELSPQNAYTWSPKDPWKLTSKFSDLTYPNDQFPEDNVLTVKNKRGETVEYPYYEDENNKKYFFTAHIWYKQKDYVIGELVDLAKKDPLGAARIIHRFAEVYEGWVPTNDYPWNNQPIDPSTGPPYHWWGGKWYRWAAAELFNFRPIVEAYSIVNETNAFEVLSEEIGEDVEQKIIKDMFEPTIEFYHTFPVLYHNMEDNNALGLIALGKALNDSKYLHEAVEWTENFVRNTYLFDGFFQETSISYHNQSTDGVNTVIDALYGWSDPKSYISPRSGIRLENLDMKDKFPVLKKSSELPKMLVYPNGKVIPTQDTWASEKPSNPLLDAGSFLLPASGISRMQKDETQLNLTFQPKYGHFHYDPLNLTLFSRGQELLPDIGYTHTFYRKWTESTLAHNTVVVDSEDMKVTDQSKHGGNIEVFSPQNGDVQVTRASQENAYSQTDEYMREPWLIQFHEATNGEGYVLDLFRVSGGDRHEYTLQGDANHDAGFESDLPFSEYGPYLLPEGVEVREPETEKDTGSAEGHYYGYIYVRDVKKTDITDGRYDLTLVTEDSEEEKAKMKITGLVDSGDHELFIGMSPSLRATRLHGKSMDNNNEAVKYMMPKMVLRREGNDLSSQFITAMEPYNSDETPQIENIEKLEIDEGVEGDIAVQVTYGNITDIILSSVDPSVPLVVGDTKLEGKMGMIRLKDDKVQDLYLVGGNLLEKDGVKVTDQGSITGTINDVMRRAEGESMDAFIVDTKVPEEMKGNYIIVTHPDGKKHGYKIKNIDNENSRTMIEIDEMDPGFSITGEDKSALQFYPFTEWNGITSFQIENVVRNQ